MNFIIRNVLYLGLFFLMLGACKTETKTSYQRSDEVLARYGEEVKLHEGSKQYDNIYAEYGNNKELTEIITDYLGRSFELLNYQEKSREFKPDYIEYQFLVDELPLDLKKVGTIFSQSDREEFKGRKENVVLEFIKKSDPNIRSQHTMSVTFSPLANSVDPKMQYGFLNKSSDPHSQLHIKKIKSKDYDFKGINSKYYVGARTPFKNDVIRLKYSITDKAYTYSENEGNANIINLNSVEDLYTSYEGTLANDLKYGAIVSNLKKAQNKSIRSGGYYKLEGITRFLTNMELGKDYPLRDFKKVEALMRHNGTSLSDGKSYIKLIMNDTQIMLLIDVDGYVSQYQQVTVDKAKGIVEKIVLLRQ